MFANISVPISMLTHIFIEAILGVPRANQVLLPDIYKRHPFIPSVSDKEIGMCSHGTNHTQPKNCVALNKE